MRRAPQRPSRNVERAARHRRAPARPSGHQASTRAVRATRFPSRPCPRLTSSANGAHPTAEPGHPVAEPLGSEHLSRAASPTSRRCPATAPATNQKPLFIGGPHAARPAAAASPPGGAVLGLHPAPGVLHLATTLLARAAHLLRISNPILLRDSADSARRTPWPKATIFTSGSPTVAVSTTASPDLGSGRSLRGDDVRRVDLDPDHRGGLAFELLGQRVETARAAPRSRPARSASAVAASTRGTRLRAVTSSTHSTRSSAPAAPAISTGESMRSRPFLPRTRRRIRSQRSLTAPRPRGGGPVVLRLGDHVGCVLLLGDAVRLVVASTCSPCRGRSSSSRRSGRPAGAAGTGPTLPARTSAWRRRSP